jgi:ribosomal protein S27AE
MDQIDNITYMDVKLEDLNYFWTKSGVPCFMANRDNIEEEIEFLGFNIYYLICNVATDRKVETNVYDKGVTTKNVSYVTDLSTKIVKIVNNFVGRTVSEIVDEDLFDFDVTRETAEYSLPAIPRVIIDKLDEFFRLVHAQHGTESIVLLTFDPQFEGQSQGWGVLVPDQVNTSVHCKYDADSIVDQKPEDVLIVGSVHSHPDMAAYASGTDHADQADFDGIHITYGWQKSINNGATQYHIEMQMAGHTYTLKPEDVFEDYIFLKEPDPQVVEWTSKVKKALPPKAGGLVTQVAQASTIQLTTQAQGLQQDSTRLGTRNGDPQLQQYPDPKDDEPYLVIGEVDSAGSECPSCHTEVLAYHAKNFYCDTCDMCFALISDSYVEIIDNAKKYLIDRKLDPNVTYYLWTKDDKEQDLLMRIKEVDYNDDDSSLHASLLSSNTKTWPYPSEATVEVLDGYFYEGFDHARTVCCDIPLSLIEECNCQQAVYYDDVIEFDHNHPYNVYDNRSNCADCEFYYSRNCKPYLNSIVDFAVSKRIIENPITQCQDYVAYEHTSSLSYYD